MYLVYMGAGDNRVIFSIAKSCFGFAKSCCIDYSSLMVQPTAVLVKITQKTQNPYWLALTVARANVPL